MLEITFMNFDASPGLVLVIGDGSPDGFGDFLELGFGKISRRFGERRGEAKGEAVDGFRRQIFEQAAMLFGPEPFDDLSDCGILNALALTVFFSVFVAFAVGRAEVLLEEAGFFGVGAVEVVSVEPHLQQSFAGAEAVGVAFEEGLVLDGLDVFEEGADESVFAGKVVIDDAGAGAGFFGEQRHGGVVKAALDDEVEHGVEDGLSFVGFFAHRTRMAILAARNVIPPPRPEPGPHHKKKVCADVEMA